MKSTKWILKKIHQNHRQFTAFITLCFLSFMMGCYTKGGSSPATPPSVQQYNTSSEIKEAWRGLYEDKEWKEAWKKTDRKKLNNLTAEYKNNILAYDAGVMNLLLLKRKLEKGEITTKEELKQALTAQLDSLSGNTTKMADSFTEYYAMMKNSGLGDIIEKHYASLMKHFPSKEHPYIKANRNYWGTVGLDKDEVESLLTKKAVEQVASYWKLMDKVKESVLTLKNNFIQIKASLTDEAIEEMLKSKKIFKFEVQSEAEVRGSLPVMRSSRGDDEDSECGDMPGAPTAQEAKDFINCKAEEKINETLDDIRDPGKDILKYGTAVAAGSGLLLGTGIGVAIFSVVLSVGLPMVLYPEGIVSVAFWAMDLFTYTYTDTYFVPNLPTGSGNAPGDQPTGSGSNIYTGGGLIDGDEYNKPSDSTSNPNEYPLFYANRSVIATIQSSTKTKSAYSLQVGGNTLYLSKRSKNNLFNYIKSRYYAGKYFKESDLEGVRIKAVLDMGFFHAQADSYEDTFVGIVKIEKVYLHKAPILTLEVSQENGEEQFYLKVKNHESYNYGYLNGYEVEASTDSDFQTIVSTTPFDQEKINLSEIEDLKDNTSYFFRVKGKGSGKYKDSAHSNIISVVPKNKEPGKLEGLSISGNTISWNTSPDEDILGYNVYIGDQSGFVPTNANRVNARLIKGTSFDQLVIPDSLGWAGKTKYLTVTALDYAGAESGPSGYIAFTVPNQAPKLATNLSAFNVSSNAFFISWEKASDSDGEITGYNIYKRISGETWEKANSSLKNANEAKAYQFTGLSSGTAYEVKIEAVDNTGASAYSDVKTVTTKAYAESFALKVNNIDESSVQLYWNRPAESASYFKVYANGTEVYHAGAGQYYKIISNLNEYQNYTFELKAFRADGSFISSASINVNTLAKKFQVNALNIPAKSDMTHNGGGKYTVPLSWETISASGIEGYNVYLSEAWPFQLNTAQKLNTTAGSINLSELAGNIRYYVAVVPVRYGQEGLPKYGYFVTPNTKPIYSGDGFNVSNIDKRSDSAYQAQIDAGLIPNDPDGSLHFSMAKLKLTADATDHDPDNSPLGGGHVKGYRIEVSPNTENIGENPIYVVQPLDKTKTNVEQVLTTLQGDRNYTFSIQAVDNSATSEAASEKLAPKPLTTLKNIPLAPVFNIKARTSSYIDIEWVQPVSEAWSNKPTDADYNEAIVKYEVYQNDKLIKTLPASARSFRFTTSHAQKGQLFNIKVLAVDNNGEKSDTLKHAPNIYTSLYLLYHDFNKNVMPGNIRMTQNSKSHKVHHRESDENFVSFKNEASHSVQGEVYKQFMNLGINWTNYLYIHGRRVCGGSFCLTKDPIFDECLDWDAADPAHNHQVNEFVIAGGTLPHGVIPEKIIVKLNFSFSSATSSKLNRGEAIIGLRIDGKVVDSTQPLDIRSGNINIPLSRPMGFNSAAYPGRKFEIFVNYNLLLKICTNTNIYTTGKIDNIKIEYNYGNK